VRRLKRNTRINCHGKRKKLLPN